MKINQPITKIQRMLDVRRPIVTKTDLTSKISYANPAFLEISGFSREELIGQPHNMVRHPDMPAAAFADMWAVIKSGRPWQALVKNRSKDGGYYWVDAYATPVTEGGQRVGYMSVRSAPTQAQITTAEALYQAVNEGTKPFPKTPAPPRLRISWMLACAIAIPVLMAELLLNLGLTRWFSFPLVLAAMVCMWFAMLQAISKPLQAAWLAILHISEGNLNTPLQGKACLEFTQLLISLESMRVNLRAIIADSVTAANDVGKQADTLNLQTRDLMARSRHQSDGVSSVAAALEQLSVAVGEIAEATSRGASYADDARGLSKRGTKLMSEVQISSEHVAKVVGAAQSTIGEMAAAVLQIGAITQTIREIAEQTNLLALNAAIEAARAGESGRGFAVVADEVRKLAERTAASTVGIAGMIETVKGISKSALTSMQQAVGAVEEGGSRIQTTRDSLKEIEAATEGVAHAGHEVANVLAQQSQASTEVAESMERMSALTEQNSASVDRVAASSKDLFGIAQELHTLLRHFERSL